MLPGRKIKGIFGFVLIKNFTECTDCLREEILVFVNRVAGYVHFSAADFNGAANKNLGPVFVLVWKIDGSKMSEGELADGALKSMVRCCCEVKACPDLQKFAMNWTITVMV